MRNEYNKKEQLIRFFENAIENKHKFIGVKIKIQGFVEPEIVINPRENFENKLKYYRKSYDENLVLKTYSGIEIIGFASGKMRHVIESLEVM